MGCRPPDSTIASNILRARQLLYLRPSLFQQQRCRATTIRSASNQPIAQAASKKPTKPRKPVTPPKVFTASGPDPTPQVSPDRYDATISEAEFQKSVWEASQPKKKAPASKRPKVVSPRSVFQPTTHEASTAALWSTLRAKLRAAVDPLESTAPNARGSKAADTTITKPAKSRVSASKPKQRKAAKPLDVQTLTPSAIPFVPVGDDHSEVPKLSYNLDRVLFNPGVYQMQDPRSQVYNFDPYLTSIMPVEEFDFDALKAYITSSKDSRLLEMSRQQDKKYCGSTSSMTSILSHFHYLLSGWRKPNMSSLSRSLEPESENFTKLTRSPASVYVRYNDGVYAIDADKEYDRENVLSMLGKSMEKLLTLPKEEYEKYRRTRSHLISEEEKNADEAFHYTTLGDFLMRSQLDAYDPRLPGTGVFDLKTRAVISVRMDVDEYREGRGYEIRNRFGQYESFEREYYDLIRAAFLKYSLQVRMGRMDGIFLAYHNTQRIFGFQYVSLEEMDHALHGTSDRRLGDQEFKASVQLLNDLLNRATKRFPGRSLRLHVETRPTKVPLTYVFIEPVTDDDMKTSQEDARKSVEKVQDNIMSMRHREREAEDASQLEGQTEPTTEHEMSAAENEEATEEETFTENEDEVDDVWEEMIAKVEETVEDESLGLESVREAVHDALAQRNLLQHSSQEERQHYLDALVETLTTDSSGLKDIRESAETEDASLETQEQQDPSSAQTGSKITPSQADSGLSTQEALKDLIVKVTQGISERQRELRAFERVVAQLAAKDTQSDGTTGSGSPDDSERHARSEDEEQSNATTTEEATELEGETDAEKLSSVTEAEETDVEGAVAEENNAEETSAEEADSEEVVGEESEQKTTHSPNGPTAHQPKELMAMYVTIRNKVNGEFVERPEDPNGKFNWSIQYTINEISEKEAQTIYPKLRRRRFQALRQSDDETRTAWSNNFRDNLKQMAKKGEKYRQKLEEEQAGTDVYVAWEEKPFPPEARTQGIPDPSSSNNV